MTEQDKKIQDQQMLIDKLRKQIEMLTAENKLLQIRLTSITELAIRICARLFQKEK